MFSFGYILLYKKGGSYAANKIEVKTGGYLHVKLAVFCFIQTDFKGIKKKKSVRSVSA